MGRWITLDTPHGPVQAWHVAPEQPAHGAIIVVQEIYGANAHIRTVAERLAEAGHVALAPAMFDPVGEQEFIAHCRDLMTTRTVILITHRPASLALADRVLCLQEGKLQELLEAPGQGITAAVPES